MLLLASTPTTALASDGPRTGAALTVKAGAARVSAISQGTVLVHADMHNHTVMSDGDGDPGLAFASMRAAGLDVAALTDHANLFSINGLSKSEWNRTGTLADAADHPGAYTAIRGFEWSHPLLGHVNVWFTATYADMEMFNRGDDYLFDGWAGGQTSPLNRCLNAGWRTGLTGVSDEHGTNWGFPEDKGRTGLWVTENTRAGVQEAMRARRFFATRVSGLRLDAGANGVRMGGVLPIARGDVTFAVDLDRGPEWDGKPLRIQVLRPATTAPTVVDVVDTVANTVVGFTVPLNVADGNWVVLRVSDPTQANASPGPAGHPCNDSGVAYSSPWWLQP